MKIQVTRQIAQAFCQFVYEVPVGTTFDLYNLQGALRFFGQGRPADQDYSALLSVTQEEGWIVGLPNQPGTYRRIGHPRSQFSRFEIFSTLKDRILHRLGDPELQWMLPRDKQSNCEKQPNTSIPISI